MQRSGAATGEHGCTAEGMWLRRERELVAQLHELLFPSPAPTGGAPWTTSSSGLNVAECLSSDECSPVISKEVPCEAAPAVSCGGRQRRRGALGKRVRGDEQDELEEQYGGDGANAKPRCSRRKKKHGTRTLVTTVPDFDGYQWRKYSQKQIECAKYPRGYYRCTYSTDQGCPAKRTVQRNDDDDDDRNGGDGGGPPKYTVVYISEHTCKATESVAPVILETTVRTKKPSTAAASATHVIPAAAAPDNVAVVVPAAESPAISDITWSSGGDTNTTPSEEGDYSRVLGAVDDCHWDRRTTAPAAAALLQEMDLFAGPIRSPVHIAADGWIDDLFVNAPSVLNSCQLFG